MATPYDELISLVLGIYGVSHVKPICVVTIKRGQDRRWEELLVGGR